MMSTVFRLLLVLCFFLLPLPANAQSLGLLFEQANRLYAEGKYSESVQTYKQILQNGYESGELYFNLGNAYYKLDRISESILYYEKANKFIPNDEALQLNLQIARLKTIDEIEPVPKLFLEVWWQSTIQLLAVDTYAWLTFIAFSLFSLSIALLFIFRKAVFRTTAWIFMICFIILLLLFLGRIYDAENNRYGIITDKTVSVVSEPAISSTEMFILHEGTKVKINRILDGWYEISLADGKTGWMRTDELEPI